MVLLIDIHTFISTMMQRNAYGFKYCGLIFNCYRYNFNLHLKLNVIIVDDNKLISGYGFNNQNAFAYYHSDIVSLNY